MRITVWDPSRKVNHLKKVIGDRKIIDRSLEIEKLFIFYPNLWAIEI